MLSEPNAMKWTFQPVECNDQYIIRELFILPHTNATGLEFVIYEDVKA